MWFERYKRKWVRFARQPTPFLRRWRMWVGAWAEGQGYPPHARLFRARELREGMRDLLAGTAWARDAWHAWRRGGAFVLFSLGATWEEIGE